MAKHCDKCMVNVTGAQTVCPLCQAQLNGEESCQRTFPFIDTIMHKHNLLIRILFFISAVLVVLCFAANYLFPFPGFWSLFVVIGVVCMWTSVSLIVRKRHNIPKTILVQAILLSTVVLALDLMTGWHRWSITYAAPCFFIVAILAVWAVAFILRLPLEHFLVYLLIDLAIGVIPIFFILFGWVSVNIPSLLCVLASTISFVALLSFKEKALGNEVKKRLHM